MKPYFHSVQFATLEQAEPVLQRYLKFFITFLYGSVVLYGAMYFFRSSLEGNSTSQIVSGPSKMCYRPNSNSAMAAAGDTVKSIARTFSGRPVGSARTSQLLKWSNKSTWEGGAIPSGFQIVKIPANSAVLLDQNVDVKNIIVEGILVVDYSKDINIATELLLVQKNTGYFELGTPTSPYTRNATITLKGNDLPSFEMNHYKSIMAMNSGEISVFGEKRDAWTMLNATANAGSRTITLESAVNWSVGDSIMVTTTSIETNLIDPLTGKRVKDPYKPEKDLEGKDFRYNETEVRAIQSISTDKKTITLTRSLTYRHFGELQNFTNKNGKTWKLDERAEVGLLTRNIKIQGDASSRVSRLGGHIMAMSPSKVNLSGVELSAMGQEKKLGRYPFHWHLAKRVNGQFFKNSIVKNCFNRAITIHGTHNAVVDSNVVYNTQGHAIFIEDGNEVDNRVHYNLVSVVKMPSKKPSMNLLPSDTFSQGNRVQGPAGIWISNPQNTITYNAVSATGTGLWNSYASRPGGNAINYVNISPSLPITNLDNNRAHACYVGLMFDFTDNTNRNDVIAASYFAKGQKVRNFTGFKNYRSIWYRGVPPLEFTGFTIGDDEGRGSFISTTDGLFTNGLVVGRSKNITGPERESFATSMYDGVETIRNCHFVNLNGKQNVFLIFGGGVKHLPHYTENVTFDSCTIFDPNDDNHFSPSVSFVEDMDGSLTGNRGWWMTTAHPFIIDDSTNFPPLQAGASGRKTRYAFGRLGITWKIERNDPDSEEAKRKGVLYYEHANGHIAHTKPAGPRSDIPLILDRGKRAYKIRFCDKIPDSLNIDWGKADPGTEAFFKLTGMPEELNVIQDSRITNSEKIQKLSSVAAVKASTTSSYAFVNGEMHFHLVTPSDRGLFFRLKNKSNREILTAKPDTSRPFKTNSINKIIEAEHFDYGGQNVAYLEAVGSSILGGDGGKVFDVRPGEILDFDHLGNGKYALVDFAKDQWVNYTVNIPKDGIYKLEANMQTQISIDQKLELLVDGVSKGQLTIPKIRGAYQIVNLGNFNLKQGKRVIRFKALTSYARMDWFRLSSGALPPEVNLTSPANNASFNAPATVNLAANANDDVSITKVEFFNADTKLGEDLTSPYTFTWSNVAAGTYAITAKATDNSGNISVSDPVNIRAVAPNILPKVRIASPSNNATFNAPYNLTIKAIASDTDGYVRKVEFFNGATKLGTDSSSPFEYIYNSIPAGTYTLTARATDDDGAVTTSSVVNITIRLVNDCAGVPGGTAKLDTCGVCVGGTTGKTTLNTDGDRLPDCVDTDDDNDGVLDVNDCAPLNRLIGAAPTWYQDTDGDGKGDPNASRVACTQPTGYVANNTDQCPADPLKTVPGNCGCGKTEASCANKLPSVTFIQPLNLGIVEAGSALTVSVDARDLDGNIANVALYIDNLLVRTDLVSPYSWGTGDARLQNLSLGAHTLRAVATDNNGGTSEATISINAKAKDCAGVLDGSAYLDVCNECVGGTTGKLTRDFDDDQIPDCQDDDDDNDEVADADDCNLLDPTVLGKTIWFADGDGDGYGDANDYIMSCTQPTGYVGDASDECPGQNNRQNAGDCGCDVPMDACFDCKGIPFGRAFLDSCLVCVETTLEACTQDCAEVWGGTAFKDSCGICAGGTTARIPVLDKSKCTVTGVLSEKSEAGWTLSPNPSTGVFYFVTLEPVDVILFNVEGQVLYEAKVTGQATLGEQLPAGFYVLRIHKNGKQVGMERLIKH